MSDAKARRDAFKAAKIAIAERIGDIIMKSERGFGVALVEPGTFTTLVEAYRAVEIAEEHDPKSRSSYDLNKLVG